MLVVVDMVERLVGTLAGLSLTQGDQEVRLGKDVDILPVAILRPGDQKGQPQRGEAVPGRKAGAEPSSDRKETEARSW